MEDVSNYQKLRSDAQSFYNSIGFIDNLLSIATHNKFNKESYKFFSDDLKNYDLIFINNIPKKSIGDIISLDSKTFLNQLIKNLDALSINYRMLSGTLKGKLLVVEKTIKNFTKRFNQK